MAPLVGCLNEMLVPTPREDEDEDGEEDAGGGIEPV
jgi:hypothetical protein